MGLTRVTIRVCRVDRPNLCKEVRNVVVDTGAMVSAIPSHVVNELGIGMGRTQRFELAGGRRVTKRVGSALIQLEGRTATDDIITTEGQPLLSVRALGGMGFVVDPRTGKVKKLEAPLLL